MEGGRARGEAGEVEGKGRERGEVAGLKSGHFLAEEDVRKRTGEGESEKNKKEGEVGERRG